MNLLFQRNPESTGRMSYWRASSNGTTKNVCIKSIQPFDPTLRLLIFEKFSPEGAAGHMSALDKEYIEQSIPHEAGHILVGRVLGIPVYRLDHEVLPGLNGTLLTGNFATVGLSPNPEALKYTPPEVLDAYMSYVAGGLAGNYLSGTMITEHGLEKDRLNLKLVTPRTLEDVANVDARPVIEANKDKWDQLQAAFERSYQKLLKGDLKVGRHTLLDGQQLDAICPQNKTRFPAFWNIGPVR
jgi:hypothetical protein